MLTNLLLLLVAIIAIIFLLKKSGGKSKSKYQSKPKSTWSSLSEGVDPTSNVLMQIVEGAIADAKSREREINDSELSKSSQTRDVISALSKSKNQTAIRDSRVRLIAEVKRSSPSKGDLAKISDPVKLAKTYETAGANLISVLTEQRRFKGEISDLVAVRAAVEIPVLRKDFIATEFQVKETKLIGADLMLLIVAALEEPKLRNLYSLAKEIGLEVLVEVHNYAELEMAMKLNPKIIGVNARNLKTLEVDESNFDELLPKIPDNVIKVAESGIYSREQVKRLEQLGTDAILVGESLVKAEDPAKKIFELLQD
jgi:indole-3-glycerol phosphate synthase